MTIVMIFQGEMPHPAHRVFGEAAECRFVHFETGVEPDETTVYTGRIVDRMRTGLSIADVDVLIAEGTAPSRTEYE